MKKAYKTKVDYLATFREEGFYHVYNRTNNKELLFRNDENRAIFLSRYQEYLSPFVDTYAYCLMNNHFHFLTRIKSLPEIKEAIEKLHSYEKTIAQKKFIISTPILESIN